MKRMSKWMIRMVAMVLIGTVYVGVSSKDTVENYPVFPVDLEMQKLMAKAGNIYPTKKYREINIVDGEKEYFAVWNYGDTAKIVDREGNVLLDTGVEASLQYDSNKEFYVEDRMEGSESGYLVASEENGAAVLVETKAMKTVQTQFHEVEVHNSGKYMLGKIYEDLNKPNESAAHYVVQTMDGKVLKESDQPLWMTHDEGYVICYLGRDYDTANTSDAGDYGLLNLETGKMEYLSKSREEIAGRALGYAVVRKIDYVNGYVLLDEEYNVAMDGQIYAEVEVCENYICTTAYSGCFSGATVELPDDLKTIKIPKIYDKAGECVYEGDAGYNFMYMMDGVVISRRFGDGKNKNVYGRLAEGGVKDEN